jgi:hydrogenase maturation factor
MTEDAEKVLRTMRKNNYGKGSTIMGEVTTENPG